MKNYIKYTILSLGLTIASASCRNEENHNEPHNHEEIASEHEHEHKEELFLSNKQIETIGLLTGSFSTIKISGFVKASGTMGVPPSAYSAVSVKKEGQLEVSKRYVEGNKVKKGEVLAYLVNPDLIQLQETYFSSKSLLQQKEAELKRLNLLLKDKAIAVKDVQQAQADFDAVKAQKISIEKQLEYYGIHTANLTPETMTEKIPILSPMSGYITTVTMYNGMYVLPSQSLMNILSTEHLHLELNVFEKDIASVKVGQAISYTVPALGNKVYQGEVSVIGKEFDVQSKTIRVHGHLEGEQPSFFKDMFIEAKIWLNNKTVKALPDEAILTDGETKFIFLAQKEKNGMQFTKLNVKTGVSEKGFTEVTPINNIPANQSIVIKGAYYVYAQSQAGELEHEH